MTLSQPFFQKAENRKQDSPNIVESSANSAMFATEDKVTPVEKSTSLTSSTPTSTYELGNDDQIPDGGFRAWTVVFGAWCCLFVSFGWVDCIGIFQSYYQAHQLKSYPPSAVAWITSVEASVMYVSAPIFGKIYDNYGPAPLLYIGAFAHVFGLMMTSLGQEYYQILLAQSICSAFGAAAVFYAGNNPIGTWFFKRRALAYGVAAAGASVSGVVLPVMISRLLPKIGFGWTMRVCSFMFLLLLIFAALTVKPRTRPEPRPWVLSEFLKPMKERLFLFNFLGYFFFVMGVWIPFNFIVTAAQHYGMDDHLASYQIAILNGTSIAGRILPGWLGDRFGRFNIMIGTTILTTLLVFGLWIPARSPAPTIAFSVLFGFTSGTFVSMGPALVQQISKVDEIGMRMGTSFCFVAIAVLIGNPIAGALISRNDGEYLYLQIFCGLVMTIGSIFLIAARYVQCGWRMEVV